jgi:thymidylate synthase (FAD)
MEIVKPSIEIINLGDVAEMLRTIELAYRICYKSEGKMWKDFYDASFISSKIKMGHETPLEHEKVTVRVVCDRGVSHEWVRHRIASPSQESTRYCNYNKNGLMVIHPGFWDPTSSIFRPSNPNFKECYETWLNHMEDCEFVYNKLISLGATPQEARTVLGNSTKTEIVFSANLREWRHFFKLRAVGTTGKPHPQMLEITIPLLEMFKERIPVIFDDLKAKF